MTSADNWRLPETEHDPRNRKSVLSFDDGNGGNPGSLITYYLTPHLVVHDIDIHSQRVPSFMEVELEGKPPLKVNYCFEGRCELTVCTGEYIYQEGREASIDTGQARSAFFFPSERYSGVEIVASAECVCELSSNVLGCETSVLASLYDRCSSREHPLIAVADDEIADAAKRISQAAKASSGIDLVAAYVLEFLLLLDRHSFQDGLRKRSYCTASQKEIAQRAHDDVSADLSKRVSVRDLAERYGVSETSVKNYFRNVYGIGIVEYQKDLRLQTAADMLRDSNKKVVEIALAVGYASQSKFITAFKERFGKTPLEHRRASRMQARN